MIETRKHDTVIIFGGTFDPPTNAHISIAQSAKKAVNADAVYFVPVGDHYIKRNKTSSYHRAAMVSIALAHKKDMFCDLYEINADHRFKTIETLRHFAEKHETVYLLIGSDKAKQLDHWYLFNELIKEFKLILAMRGNDDLKQIMQSVCCLQGHENRLIEIKTEYKDISSTCIRNAIANQDTPLNEAIDQKVLEYIYAHNLYQEKGEEKDEN